MSSWESQLISKVVSSASLDVPRKFGITAEDFLTNEGRAIFQYLIDYSSNAQTYGSVLGSMALSNIFPNYVLYDDPGMSQEAVCYELRKKRIDIELARALRETDTQRGVDPLQALTELGSRLADLRRLASGGCSEVDLATGVGNSYQRYQNRKMGYTSAVAMWPWAYVNNTTGGIQPDEYGIIFGRPKNKKSWVLYSVIKSLQEQNKKCLIYTRESPEEQFSDRMLCLHAKVNYSAFRAGRLIPEDEYKINIVREWLDMARAQNRVMLMDASTTTPGTDTVDWLGSKIQEYNPDVVLVDGLYLMTDARTVSKRAEDYVRVRNISRDLRQLILSIKKPVIGTIQANRAAGKNVKANSEEIAFSDALAQDATQFWRVISEKRAQTVACVVGGARESTLESFRINGQCAEDFSFMGVISDESTIEGAEDTTAGKKSAARAKNEEAAKQVALRMNGK